MTFDRLYEPYRSIAESSGYRAVQSTPIIKRDGTVIGILSTHFAEPHQWSKADLPTLDDHASRLGTLVTELLDSASV